MAFSDNTAVFYCDHDNSRGCFIYNNKKILKNKVVNLVAQGNRQQINNVNSYLGKIEDTAALLFSDELYYEFDATAPALDTFEKLQTEKTIKNRLDDLGILENFSDFGIVYADDSTIGWISNTTIQLFPNGGLFAYLDNNINITS